MFQNCSVIDGIGAPAFTANVGFSQGRVYLFRDGVCPPATETIDAGGQTAAFFGLTGKGVLVHGMDADALLLDLDAFTDTATYQNGAAPCEGIRGVFISKRHIELS